MDHIEEIEDRTMFGFWSYLMTDCILFSVLFALYLLLHNNTAGGPTTKELYDLPYVMGETFCLLASSFTVGLAMLSLPNKNKLLFWFFITFLLGAGFVAMELIEFTRLVHDGNSWTRSAFLSSFFTLVGTHGCHVSIGLLWMIVLLIPVALHGPTRTSIKRLNCLRMFWHFLDVVWIFIFTIVYLMGAL
jgi:cytochrome o ubiquinol oxidase subunit 3